MRDMIYFGNRERMTWVRAPDANYDGSRQGWVGGATTLLNGGTIVQRSTSAHRTYSYTWNMMSRDEIRNIQDYAEGVWGPGAIYMLDPFAMDRNVLPQHWASPRTVLQDAPVLSGSKRSDAPEFPVDLSNLWSYPTRGILYAYSASWPLAQYRPKLFIPIPSGYTAWFGAHGQPSATSGLTVTPVGGLAETMPILTTNTDQRFSSSWDGSQYSGVELSFSLNSGSAVISGMMMQILPTGVIPKKGAFISGQGHSGLRFATQPSLTNNNIALDRQSLSAQLIEDEAWR